MCPSVPMEFNFSLFYYILPLLVTPIIIFFLNRKSRNNNNLNLPPGSFGWPVLGDSLEFLRVRDTGSSEKFILERVKRYNSEVFKTSLLGEPMVVLSGPAGNKFLFSNEHKLVTLWWPASVNKLLGKCISTCSGVEGMSMRKMVSYFFSPDAMAKLYIKPMDIVSQQHLNTYWQGTEELVVYPAMKLYTFELACRLFMSIHDPDVIKRLAALFQVFTGGIISIPFNFPGTKFYKAAKATTAIKKELLTIVRHRREALEQRTANTPSQDLLSHLLVSPVENGQHMPESVIVNNILLMLFAGHDTSSSAITILIKVLAEHPHVYDKVLKEQDEIGRGKVAGEYLDWEDIQKMKYSWNVVCETIRMWPPVIGAFREALTDITYGGYHIPKGWKLYWNAKVTHGDSEFFPDSEKFNPARFEQGEDSIPYTYIPFGGGPRMCLGKEFARLEMLTFLHNVVRRFRWSLVDPHEKILCKPFPTPEKGLPIRLLTT